MVISRIWRIKMRNLILTLTCIALLAAPAVIESQGSEAVEPQESAELLCGLLEDPDETVRRQAIHGLRMMARRTDRVGGIRLQRGEEFPPQVEGLVPYLVSAANDEVEANRICALYALADTRDPLAVLELRNRLKDPSRKVRFHAACFLTEYEDASGLPEMRDALGHLHQADQEDYFERYAQAEILLASFERIIGKRFGPIPMNPALCSDTREIPKIEERYETLLDTWAQWWAWEPKANTN
jgi:HEAT repeat protein